MALLECKNLTIGYGSKVIQKDLSFTVEKGDYFLIIGENGAGKSTLIKTLLGYIKPLSGSFSFEKGPSSVSLGYLPQTSSIQRDFPATVWEIVLSGCQGRLGFLPFYSSKEKQRAMKNLETLGVAEYKNKSFKELSGGQQQRVLLARTLCAADDIILLDEPCKGFDSRITEEMYELIKQLHEKGMTVIMISHDVETARKYATKVMELKRVRTA